MRKETSSSRSRATRLVVLLSIVLLSASLAWAEGSDDDAPSLVKVEQRYVCMVNNQLFPNEQIPVKVEEKTYYGCCEMCKERLSQQAESRQAVDPVSGKSVDKATCVIGAQPDGKVFYFESDENLEKYRSELESSSES